MNDNNEIVEYPIDIGEICLDDADLEIQKERHRDLRQIEVDVQNLNEIFGSISNQVDEQGEALDSIDALIGDVEERTESTAESLQFAEKSNNNYMTKVIAAAAVIGTGVITAVSLIFWKKSDDKPK